MTGMAESTLSLWQIPDAPGRRRALLLTFLMHGFLAAFLFFGVQWRQQQEVVEVELWSDIPRPATVLPPTLTEPNPPKPVEKPEPKVEAKPPAKPDIALRDEKKKKPEPKAEAKPEPKAPWKDALEREAKQFNDQREAQAKRERANQLAALADAEQKAAARASSLASYVGKIRMKIRGNITLPLNIQGNPEAVFEVKQLPTGEILDVPRLVKSSGNPSLDSAIERAILKSSPLPKPDDPSLFQRILEIRYRPFD